MIKKDPFDLPKNVEIEEASNTRIDIIYNEIVVDRIYGNSIYGETAIHVECKRFGSSKRKEPEIYPYNLNLDDGIGWHKKYLSIREAELDTIRKVCEFIEEIELEGGKYSIFVQHPSEQKQRFNNPNYAGIMNDGEIEYSEHIDDIKWLLKKTEEVLIDIIDGNPTGYGHLFGRNYLL